MSGSNLLAADLEDQPVAQDIMTDGIMQIAGGIETIVQQLQLQVQTLTAAWLFMHPSLCLDSLHCRNCWAQHAILSLADSSFCRTLSSARLMRENKSLCLGMQATRATIRVELPSVSLPSGPPSLMMIHLDSIKYSGNQSFS